MYLWGKSVALLITQELVFSDLSVSQVHFNMNYALLLSSGYQGKAMDRVKLVIW